jgi:hypothetical protein
MKPTDVFVVGDDVVLFFSPFIFRLSFELVPSRNCRIRRRVNSESSKKIKVNDARDWTSSTVSGAQPGSKVKFPVPDGVELGAEETPDGPPTGEGATPEGAATPEDSGGVEPGAEEMPEGPPTGEDATPEGTATPEDSGSVGSELGPGSSSLVGGRLDGFEGAAVEGTFDSIVLAAGRDAAEDGVSTPEEMGGITDASDGFIEDTPDSLTECGWADSLAECTPDGLGMPE